MYVKERINFKLTNMPGKSVYIKKFSLLSNLFYLTCKLF